MHSTALALVLGVSLGWLATGGIQDPGKPPKTTVPPSTPLRDLIPERMKPGPVAPIPGVTTSDVQTSDSPTTKPGQRPTPEPDPRQVPQDPAVGEQPGRPVTEGWARPRPPSDLKDRVALPPVDEPFMTPVERRDLIQEFTEPNPLEGIYHLRSIQRPGVVYTPEARGYLAIGRRTLILHVQANPTVPTRPYIQSGARSYHAVGDTLQMTTLVGHRNDDDGNIHIEKPGILEVRRFSLIGPMLRIYQGPTSFYEFERIE